MFAAFGVHLVGVVAAGVPAPPLDLELHTVEPGVERVQLVANFSAQLFAGGVSVEYPAVNQPAFLTLAERPDATLVAVVLGIDAANQHKGPIWNLWIHLAAAVERFPLHFLALVFFPGFAKRGVGKGLELADVALGFVEVEDDPAPGCKRAIGRPDVEGHRVRRWDRLIISIKEVEPVTGPDACFLADPATFCVLVLHFVLLNNAGVVLAQVPSSARAFRVPLDAVGTILATPFEVLLGLAVRARHMQPEQVR